MSAERAEVPAADPHAKLEHAFIQEYLERRGYTPATLRTLTEPEAIAVMRQASLYASGRLTEVESRAHLVDDPSRRAARLRFA